MQFPLFAVNLHAISCGFLTPTRRVFSAAALLFPLLACISAHAQAVSLFRDVTTVGSGLNRTGALAVDRAGNLFIADSGNNRIVEIPAAGGPQITVASGLNSPQAVAVDAAGDLFIADTGNNRVIKIAVGGHRTTIGTGLSGPQGVAIDASGNVFISDAGHNQVIKVAIGGAQTTLVTGLDFPRGLAVDNAGNLFIADTQASSGRLLKVAAGTGTVTVVIQILDSLFTDVAVDAAGHIFIADSENDEVFELGSSGTILAGGPLLHPQGVAVDAAGNVYIADIRADVLKVPTGNVTAADEVCPAGKSTPAPCSQTITLDYQINSPTTFGPTKVVTQGTPDLDFTLISTNCTGFSDTGNFCNVVLKFTPLAPGLRAGAVQLTDSSGKILTTTFLHGVGLGPAIAFNPALQTSIGSGLVEPTAAAVDAAGNAFVVDQGDNQVLKIPANGASQTSIGAGLNQPHAVAIDGAGDVFIADSGNNRVVEVPAGGGPQISLGTHLNHPTGVAVDGAGNLFIADFLNDRVVEIPTSGGAQFTLNTGHHQPESVAVDAVGDLFIADPNLTTIREFPAGGAPETGFGDGLRFPSALALDAAGDIFVADSGNSRVVEISAASRPQTIQTTIGTGLTAPLGVAVDSTGNVFIAELGSDHIMKVHRSTPPSLSFAVTPVNTVSSDSPQSITAQNIGNQPLKAVPPGLSIGANFFQAPGLAFPPNCTSTFSLIPGAACGLSVSFKPQSFGVIRSSATFTDNALNATAAKQIVPLHGTASGQPPTITSVDHATFTAGKFGSFTITATGSPAPTFTECCELPAGLTFSPTGVISGIPKCCLLEQGNVFIFTITADNGIEPRATQQFTLLLDQSPIIMTDNSATFTVGSTVSFQVKALGFPPPTFTASGALPTGIHFLSNGSFTGKPAPGTAGTYIINITASNGVLPNFTQKFTLTVNDFTLDVSPPSQTISAGNIAHFGVSIASLNGLTGSVSVTCTGLPANSSCDISPNPLQLPTTSNPARGTATVFVPTGTTGTFTLSFTATTGNLTHTTQAKLNVQ